MKKLVLAPIFNRQGVEKFECSRFARSRQGRDISRATSAREVSGFQGFEIGPLLQCAVCPETPGILKIDFAVFRGSTVDLHHSNTYGRSPEPGEVLSLVAISAVKSSGGVDRKERKERKESREREGRIETLNWKERARSRQRLSRINSL